MLKPDTTNAPLQMSKVNLGFATTLVLMCTCYTGNITRAWDAVCNTS